MSDFGQAIKTLRKDQKITQRELAEKCGVNFTYISKIENGQLENSPSEYAIRRIAETLNADADHLIFLAKKIPEAIKESIVEDATAVAFLRRMHAMSAEERKKMWDLVEEGEKRKK